MQCLHAAPVEFHGGSDAVSTRTEHDDRAAVVGKVDVALHTGVGHVEVVGLSRIFGGKGINLFHDRQDAVVLAEAAHDEQCLVHVSDLLFQACGAGDLEVGEAIDFCLTEQLLVERVDVTFLQMFVNIDDMLELIEEPAVNLRQVVNLVHSIAFVHGFGDDEDTLVGRLTERLVDIGNLQFLVLNESVHALANHAETFLDSFLKVTADSHHLTYRLHAGTELLVYAAELAKVPARYLADYVVESRLKECRCSLGDGVLQFKETIAQSKLGGNEGERIACSLGGKGRRARETRINLDDTIVFKIRIESVLHVAFADNADMSHNLDGQCTELVVFGVGKRLRRSDDDTLTRMDAKRIKVLHVTHCDTVVVTVAHYLIFNLFPSFKALLYKHLGREREGLLTDLTEFLVVISEAGAQSAECVSSTHDDGVA